jgi:S-adenosylmethionine:tRNA ribosyltransferase-isomerase
VEEHNGEGHRRLTFQGTPDLAAELEALGEIPLPPYIKRAAGETSAEDRARYQTVYARARGSIAAPTAGLHFTGALLETLRAAGVETCFITLHVGLGTFAPVKTGRLEDHPMHEERYSIPEGTAVCLERARREQRRVIAVGTTSLRALESAVREDGRVPAVEQARTRIFLYPPCQFRVARALLTNFHLPCSTLLMLVSAFAAPGETRGRQLLLAVYEEAVRERYRFFSYGDAMLIQ